MLFNILKTASRNFLRNLQYSFINLFGFSLGLLSFLLIILYVNHEKNFDRFHDNSEQLYRAGWIMKSPTDEKKLAVSTAAFGPSLFDEFPSIIDFTRLSNPGEGYLRYADKDYKTRMLVYADSSFFRMFSFDLLQGDPLTCLQDPYSIVLSSSLARKIFGDEDPMGKSLKWNKQHIFTVTGVVADHPSKSHIRFTALASFSTLYTYDNVYLDWNGGLSYYTYILLGDKTNITALEPQLGDFMHAHINYLYEQAGWKVIPHFQNMKDIYLDDTVLGGLTGNPVRNMVYMVVAVFILILVCINFMNLSTARYSSRAGEVAVRKTFGAARNQIIRQFLGESLLMTTLGMIIALILLEAFTPLFNEITGKELNLYDPGNLRILLALPFIILFISLTAGSYPAFYLSGFSPLFILRSKGKTGNGSVSFRNFLVLFQFAVSIILIISTLMVYKQVRFLREHDLGFDKENLIILPMSSHDFRQKHEIVQDEISGVPGVISTAAIAFFPGEGDYSEGFQPEGYDQPVMFNKITGDYGMIRTLGLEISEGRGFSRSFGADTEAIMINESLARSLGWDDPLGKNISRNGDHEVIGVVKDFNFTSLSQPIRPLIIGMVPYDGYTNILVRFKTENIKNMLASVERVWKSIDPYEPFDYSFVDARLENLYKADLRSGQIFMAFAILAMIIASLGVYGLASFEAERRTREIGIRKVLGSSSRGIIRILVGKFTFWVALSNLIAWPAAWIIMQRWLDHFAYRTTLSISIFIAASLFSVLIALLTVTVKSYRTAIRNPVESLRYE